MRYAEADLNGVRFTFISVQISFSRQFGSTFIGNNTAWGRNLTLCHPDPDFLPRGTGQDCVCAFLLRKGA
jgi:hypothetical protein